jgi:hypothetical protein
MNMRVNIMKNYKIMLKKFLVVEVIIFMVFGLTSCGIFRKTVNQITNSGLDADAASVSQKNVAEAFIERDTSSLKKLLTKNAISKIDNLDEKLEEVINFCQGEYLSHDYYFTTGGHNNYGKKNLSIDVSITFKTKIDIYIIYYQQLIYDDINDDLGIYGLRIIIKSIASTSDNWHQINDNPDEPSIKAYYD